MIDTAQFSTDITITPVLTIVDCVDENSIDIDSLFSFDYQWTQLNDWNDIDYDLISFSSKSQIISEYDWNTYDSNPQLSSHDFFEFTESTSNNSSLIISSNTDLSTIEAKFFLFEVEITPIEKNDASTQGLTNVRVHFVACL